MFKTIALETDARGVATLTLARADKHNALSSLMIEEITRATKELDRSTEVRVVILAAQGHSFCAGGDLDWMRAQISATPDQRRTEARKLAEMLFGLNTLSKPLIGRVHGQAFGGGIGMMSVCDVAIGAEGQKFGLTEVRLGLIPATISPYVLARMGEARARRVFMSARIFDSADAQSLGLLARVVPPRDLDAAVEQEVKPYLSAAPEAVARSKKLARKLGPPITRALMDETIEELIACWEGAEAREGISAFFDKRKPRWNL